MPNSIPTLPGYSTMPIEILVWYSMPHTHHAPQNSINARVFQIVKENAQEKEKEVIIYCFVYNECVKDKNVIRINYYDNVDLDGNQLGPVAQFRKTVTLAATQQQQLSRNIVHYLDDFYRLL